MANAILDEAMARAELAADQLFAAAEAVNAHGGHYLEALVDAAVRYRNAEKNLKAVQEMLYSVNGRQYTIVRIASSEQT